MPIQVYFLTVARDLLCARPDLLARWRMVRRNFAVVTFVVLLAWLALGCAGIEEDSQGIFTETEVQQSLEPNVNVPGYWGGVVPWEYEEGSVVPVLVQGQEEVSATSGKAASSLSGIAYVRPDDGGGEKASATLSVAEGYYLAKNVAISEVNGVTFNPADGDPAYAMYQLEAPADTSFTVGLAWYSLPEAMDSYFIGIGDSEMGVWHWYQGPDDGVMTFNPDDWSEPGTVEATVLVCIAVESGKPADFWQVNWGVPEVRGTGLSFENQDNVPLLPAREGKSVSADLPTTFDMRPNVAAVSNQGSMGSCTAFACNDSAFNILLDRQYGDDGWDLTQDSLRVSPMWAYVKSGIAPIGNWDPPCGSSQGRYMSEAFNVLEEIGSAVQATVPYQATNDCSTTFEDLATTEANLLKISNWYGLGTNAGTIVNTIKTQLAESGQPVIVAMYGLESGFLNYSSGVYHYGGTYGVNAGHAMCVVGYDDSIEAFDVRNSWGGNWGASGYWWCGYDAVEDLVAEGSRMYFYTMSADYNPDAVTFFLGDGIIFDETEPNDSIASANQLPVFPVEFYSGELGNGDTADYFSFQFEAGEATEFSLTYDTGAGVVALELYDAAANLLAESSTGTGAEGLAGSWSGSGTAYLKTKLVSGAPTYSISGSERIPLPAPQNLQATDGSRSDGVMLTWEAVPGASFYKVIRASEISGEYSQISTISSTQYLDSSAQALTTYWYQVSALDLSGEGLPSQIDSGRRSAPQPTGVSASDGTFPDKVVVSWDAVPGWTTFTVKRSMFAAGPFDPHANVDGTSFEDTGVEPGSTYYYVVCLVIDGNYGPNSAADAGSIPADAGQPETVVDDNLPGNNVDTSRGNNLPGSGGIDPGNDQGSQTVPITQ